MLVVAFDEVAQLTGTDVCLQQRSVQLVQLDDQLFAAGHCLQELLYVFQVHLVHPFQLFNCLRSRLTFKYLLFFLFFILSIFLLFFIIFTIFILYFFLFWRRLSRLRNRSLFRLIITFTFWVIHLNK